MNQWTPASGTDRPPTKGQSLGQYELTELLGRGGMATSAQQRARAKTAIATATHAISDAFGR
jgi:hypothetical protein